jgi:hypothetical protein
MNVISELDHPLISKEWIILTTERGRRTFELRLRNPYLDEAGNAKQKWILCSCDQEYDEDTGTLLTIMGCMFVESRGYLHGCWLTYVEQISVHRNMPKRMPWPEQILLKNLLFERKKQHFTRRIFSRLPI